MDVAFVSEFIGDHRVFRYVDSDNDSAPIKPGDVIPLSVGYCLKVVTGQLPELIPDTSALPEAMAIPATREIPIGAHVSVAMKLSDGRIYGTFCCFSHKPNPSLNERDLGVVRVFAELVTQQIGADMECAWARKEKIDRILKVLEGLGPSIVYQPSFSVSGLAMQGCEALSRFHCDPVRSPDKWFAESGEVGLQIELERMAIQNALSGYRSIWSQGDWYLGLNSSPQTIIAGGLDSVFAGYPADRIMLEITEHEHVDDYDALVRSLGELRAKGIKIAIDDAGSGYASMRHVLSLQPDIIKLDISLTSAIDHDPMKQALTHALIEFGHQTNCKIIAEGVETDSEMATLCGLGVYALQGYRLCRPVPMGDLLRLLP